MVRLAFTSNLERHVDCPPADIAGSRVIDVLDAYFTDHPLVRGYVLDERGALRKHMVIYVDGAAVVDRAKLTDRVPANAEVWVMQALSGG